MLKLIILYFLFLVNTQFDNNKSINIPLTTGFSPNSYFKLYSSIYGI
jgi:hypothetical protein